MTSTILTYLNTLEALVDNNGEIKHYILTKDEVNFEYIINNNKELKVYSKIPLFNLKTDGYNIFISGGTSINGETDIDACYQEIKNWKTGYPTCNNGATVSDGIKGDIEVFGSGSNYSVRNGVINAVKLGGDITSYGKGLLTAVSAAIQRTLLGLGSIATASASDYILTSTKAQPNGVASLNSSGKVPSSQLPTGTVISSTDDVPEGTTNLYFTTTRVNNKVDKITGKGLSTEDYTTVEKSKLAGIALGATVNDTDANLKNRVNHTGTQLSSTISDFQTTVSSNTDVSANTSARHTHSNLSVLNAITEAFTTTLKIVYDSTVTWITTNGTNLINHLSNTSNPHSVTKTQVGLGNVTNDSQVKRSEMGVANGVATLDSSGLIPNTQLPSYIDDVIEAANLASFPATGEAGKIYVALDTNKTYRWSGSTYVYITSGAVDSVAGKTGVVTLVKADVGLSNVPNLDTTAAVANQHTHSNKALLDTYTQTEANIADAVSKKHTHANQTALDNVSGVNTGDQDLSNLVIKNTSITGATKTKITYDSKGLVTSGTDATTADIADSTNKRYVTDANLTTLGATSGTNTGDETTSSIQTKRPLKTVNGNSLEGSGNITISGEGGGISESLAIAYAIAL